MLLVEINQNLIYCSKDSAEGPPTFWNSLKRNDIFFKPDGVVW